jgi:hypothetical protein
MYTRQVCLTLLVLFVLGSQPLDGAFHHWSGNTISAIPEAAPGAAAIRDIGETMRPIAKYHSQKLVLQSTFIRKDFVPDGDLDKEVWITASKAGFHRDAFHNIEYPELETQVASLWTRHYLYLAWWCKYVSLNTFQGEDPGKERWELWSRDVVEAFINPEPSRELHYYEFEVAPNNQWLDLEVSLDSKLPHNAQWDSGFEHVARTNSVRSIWTVEMRIPVQSMGVRRIEPGVDWRINLYRADGNISKGARKLISWSPLAVANNSFHQPASFGLLRFTSSRSEKRSPPGSLSRTRKYAKRAEYNRKNQ